MKKLLLLLSFVIFFIETFSQNWLPISQNTKSVFINSELPSNLACFSIDSLDNSIVDSIIYYNYQLYGENHDDSTNYSPCGGFGPSCFLIQNEMSWFGREIIQTNNNWIFINQLNDSLKFNFQNNDTSIIFQSQNRILKLIYLNDTIINIWGYSDSLKNYKIIHQNVNGVNFNDALNNKTIRLSKHFGLLDFIDIKHYPDTLNYYSAIGAHNITDTIGKVTIKKYEEHLSLPGTITQFEHKQESYYTCCPTFHDGYYYLSTFITQSSYFDNGNYISEFILNDSINDSIVIDTNIIGYSIPFVRNDENQRVRIIYDSTECYGKGYVFKTIYTDCEIFCSTYNCYSPTEPTQNAYCSEYFITKHPNVKEFVTLFRFNNTPPPYPYPETNFIYSYANGNSCGQRAYTSLNKQKRNNFSVFPIPTSNYLNIKGSIHSILKINLVNSEGRIINIKPQVSDKIDVSTLPSGSYFLEIYSEKGIEILQFLKQ